AHRGRLPALAVQGRLLLSGGGDQAVRAWGLASLRPLWSLETAPDVLIRAEVCGDGSHWWGGTRGGELLRRGALPPDRAVGGAGAPGARLCRPAARARGRGRRHHAGADRPARGVWLALGTGAAPVGGLPPRGVSGRQFAGVGGHSG